MVQSRRVERLWSIQETAQYLGVAVKTLYQWRWRKIGPRSYTVGKFVRYRPDEVRAWVDGHALSS